MCNEATRRGIVPRQEKLKEASELLDDTIDALSSATQPEDSTKSELSTMKNKLRELQRQVLSKAASSMDTYARSISELHDTMSILQSGSRQTSAAFVALGAMSLIIDAYEKTFVTEENAKKAFDEVG